MTVAVSVVLGKALVSLDGTKMELIATSTQGLVKYMSSPSNADGVS
jgi:hypothetical protein